MCESSFRLSPRYVDQYRDFPRTSLMLNFLVLNLVAKIHPMGGMIYDESYV